MGLPAALQFGGGEDWGLVLFIFMKAVCVRSFEMSLQKTYIRIGWGAVFFFFLSLLSRHFAAFFLSILFSPWPNMQEVFFCRLLSFASPAFNLCFYSCDLLFCWQLWVNILRVVPVTWTVQVLRSECLF